jgi:outer membrane protein assembly factor BamD
MEKPDRDRTQARLAEQEFQKLILTYPSSKQALEGEQRLREVQEVLAEGDFRVGRFYYLKDEPRGYRAAIFRLADIVDRYPLYSQADKSLWMLGDSLMRLERSQMAGRYFERIVRDYPLSPMVEEAKARLTKLGVPIPQPDSKALERMKAESLQPRDNRSLARRALGIMRSGPDVSMSARVGQPNMSPPSEAPAESLVASPNLGTGAGTGGGSNIVVDTATGKTTQEVEPGSTSASSDKVNEAKASPQQKGAKEVKENQKVKESSSKKKSGLRKLIPW